MQQETFRKNIDKMNGEIAVRRIALKKVRADIEEREIRHRQIVNGINRIKRDMYKLERSAKNAKSNSPEG